MTTEPDYTLTPIEADLFPQHLQGTVVAIKYEWYGRGRAAATPEEVTFDALRSVPTGSLLADDSGDTYVVERSRGFDDLVNITTRCRVGLVFARDRVTFPLRLLWRPPAGCGECNRPEEFAWDRVRWVGGAPVKTCHRHGSLAPDWAYYDEGART